MIENLSQTSILALRLKTGLDRKAFAAAAGISIDTQRKMEQQKPVRAQKAQRTLNALNQLLGTAYELKDIDGLEIHKV